MRQKAIKTLRTVFAVSVILALVALLADCLTIPVPRHERISELSGNVSFELSPNSHSPYHLVIAVPAGAHPVPRFQGTVELQAPDGSSRIIPFASDSVYPCNWLNHVPGVSGYIIGWDEPQQLSNFLRRDVVYQARITFPELPPLGSSLWFSSMDRISLVFNRKK